MYMLAVIEELGYKLPLQLDYLPTEVPCDLRCMTFVLRYHTFFFVSSISIR
jgi:hypothetical protein